MEITNKVKLASIRFVLNLWIRGSLAWDETKCFTFKISTLRECTFSAKCWIFFNLPVSQTSMNPFSTPGMKFLGMFIPTVSSENSRVINLSPINGCRIIMYNQFTSYFATIRCPFSVSDCIPEAPLLLCRTDPHRHSASYASSQTYVKILQTFVNFLQILTSKFFAAYLVVEVIVSLKATFGFPVTQGQLYSVRSLWKESVYSCY